MGTVKNITNSDGSTTTSKLRFSYDANGKVVAVNYNGNYYYYLRNAQSDIVKLIDKTGATVVEYRYDSWGKLLSTSGSLASTLGKNNPFRYRGYVYDEETGFYYLQSRYYNPEVGRFISSDVLLSTGQGVLGHNAYAYCLNNPVNREDYTGHRASLVHTDIGMPLGGDGYIDDQSNFYGSDLSFGPAGNVADNGCGLVALYNVAKAGGLPYSFNELHDILFGGLGWVGTTNFFGSMGMNPNLIMEFFERNFGNADFGFRNFSYMYGDYDAVIILYAYTEPQIGAHYIAGINNGNGTYRFYNYTTTSPMRLEDLYSDFDKNGWLFITGWNIDF